MLNSAICLLTSFIMVMGASDYNEYGGWTAIQGEKTGYFHVEQINGKWWIIDPAGNGFISKGVNHISYGRVPEGKYDNTEIWAKHAIQRLWDWGFNTVGAWSKKETFAQEMSYTVILHFGSATGNQWKAGTYLDVFSEEFRIAVEKKAQRLCAPKSADPHLLGYFTDNELRWAADWKSSNSLFDDFFAMPAESAGKIALVNMIKEIYGDIGSLNARWKTDLSEFDNILPAKSLSDLGVEMPAEKSESAKLPVMPREMAKMYLQQFHGNIDKVNEALGTNASSFDELLTPEFRKELGIEIRKKIPKSIAVVGISMAYDSIDKANKAFGTDAKSYAELTNMLYGSTSITAEVEEMKKVQEQFLSAISERYFSVCKEAIRKVDPNHMILGCRFAGYAPTAVIQGMKGYVDIVSYNNYNKLPPKDKLAEIYGIVESPVMISEFSFKAMDSNLPNTKGAGTPVDTQEDRAHHFEKYVTELMELPYAVGFHWFEYADQPEEGRGDGEDCNYGLVNVEDKPWKMLTKKMSEVNREIEVIHKGN